MHATGLHRQVMDASDSSAEACRHALVCPRSFARQPFRLGPRVLGIKGKKKARYDDANTAMQNNTSENLSIDRDGLATRPKLYLFR